LPYRATSSFTTVAGQLVGGAEALSGCTAVFNTLASVDQGSCELVARSSAIRAARAFPA
jgi:hypothetical protein